MAAERIVAGIVKTASGSYNEDAYPVKPGGGEVQDVPAPTPKAPPSSVAEALERAMNGKIEGAGRTTDALYQ